ncbi:hypothetical protein Tco_1041420, partial [Tanacetum coccineum]
MAAIKTPTRDLTGAPLWESVVASIDAVVIMLLRSVVMVVGFIGIWVQWGYKTGQHIHTPGSKGSRWRLGAISRNLAELEDHQGSYLSIHDQPAVPLK